MSNLVMFTLILICSSTALAKSLQLTADKVKGISTSVNIEQCKLQSHFLESLESHKNLAASFLERIKVASDEDRPKLEKTLSNIHSADETVRRILEKFNNTELVTASVEFPDNTVLTSQVETDNGIINFWFSNPISQITIIGLDLCVFLDLDAERIVVTKEAIVNFLNSLQLNN